jgi:hypothetical protein
MNISKEIEKERKRGFPDDTLSDTVLPTSLQLRF